MKKIALLALLISPVALFSQVGIGTTSPSEVLDLESSNATKTALDINNTGGGDPKINFQVAGTSTFSVGIDNSDGDKFKIGTTALETNTRLTIDGSGYVGIGNTSPTVLLDVDGAVIFNESGAASNVRMESDAYTHMFYLDGTNSRIGINDATPDYTLDVEATGAAVAAFNRAEDGAVISIEIAGVQEGTISVAAGTVSYNAFTGSHFGWAEGEFERGMLVSMNNNNRFFHGNSQSEILYGIQYTATENDPTVLGAYLNVLNPCDKLTLDNPHQVMAVGNGDMWVTNHGGNIATGDYLISSSLKGHAMKDNLKHETSYVIARAAENVDWSKIQPDANGVQRVKISVFFESFAKRNYEHKMAEYDVKLQKMEAEIEELKRMLMQNEAAKK